jgi:hypothetical protein
MTQCIHEFRKEKYCEIAKLIKPMIEKYGGAFLKLFNYSENESPSDVDIFIPPNNVSRVLKEFAKTFNAKFIKKRRFLTSSIEVVLPRDINGELHIDLYLEFVFTPSHRVTSIEEIIPTKIPWCRESIEVPSPSRGFHAFFIMWHALRHRRILPRDTGTVIGIFDSFSDRDTIKFLTLVKRSKLELEFMGMLHILLLHAITTKEIKPRALRIVFLILRYLSSHIGRISLAIHYIATRYSFSENPKYYDLKLLNVVKTLRDVLRVSKVRDLYYLLRFIFTFFIREYLILLLLRLGIL